MPLIPGKGLPARTDGHRDRSCNFRWQYKSIGADCGRTFPGLSGGRNRERESWNKKTKEQRQFPGSSFRSVHETWDAPNDLFSAEVPEKPEEEEKRKSEKRCRHKRKNRRKRPEGSQTASVRYKANEVRRHRRKPTKVRKSCGTAAERYRDGDPVRKQYSRKSPAEHRTTCREWSRPHGHTAAGVRALPEPLGKHS